MGLRTVGVEEELLLVEPVTGRARAVSGSVMRRTEAYPEREERIGTELQREQLEIDTKPCTSLDELAAEVRRRRRAASEAARAIGAEIVALATSPLPVEPSMTPDRRYRWMAQEYQLTAAENLTCGCHVHVSVTSDEEGVAVLDRIRGWLPPLLAMSANSPFWQGHDTGYASYREQVWSRWPSAGPTGPFGSAQAYHTLADAMVGSGVLLDDGISYFHARLSRHHPPGVAGPTGGGSPPRPPTRPHPRPRRQRRAPTARTTASAANAPRDTPSTPSVRPTMPPPMIATSASKLRLSAG